MSDFNFDIVADKYDEFYNTEFGKQLDFVEKRLVREMLEYVPRSLSLEVGCGTGHWTEFLALYNFPIVAIDISERMLQIAKKRNLECAVFLRQDVQKMNFKHEYFHNVFAITTLEFVDNLDKALSEIYRVLRPGGFFIVGALNAQAPYVQEKLLKGDIIQHAKPFTYYQLNNLLSVFGQPIIKAAAYVDNGKVLDLNEKFSDKELLKNGAFLCGLVQKNK